MAAPATPAATATTSFVIYIHSCDADSAGATTRLQSSELLHGAFLSRVLMRERLVPAYTAMKPFSFSRVIVGATASRSRLQ
eukprot:3264180-Prymnesium_polylepis.3